MKQIRGCFHHKITCSRRTSSCTNKRKRQALTTTILTVLCLTTQIPLSSYNSDAFLLSPCTRHPSFLTRDGDQSITASTSSGAATTASAGICMNFSSKSLQLKPHSEHKAYGIFQTRNDRYRLFQSSMTAESESEVKAAEESVSVSASESASASASVPKPEHKTNTMDIPLPTEAGGYTHTNASRAKISAANKGKVPWNKGKGRSEEVKKKIAEGVRRKNRERFLAKLEDMGVTEEEYEKQKKEERRKKDAERRARRTKNGGYRPTEETKQKISKILKEKFASGEIKRTPRASTSRKGFKHSEETRAKISAALRKKWATDTEYQKKMSQTMTGKANGSTARRKISKTLKEKWQDPAFREKMMKSMKNRKSNSGPASLEQREKISAAMKKKWQDKDYRAKTMTGMEKYRDSMPKKPAAEKKKKKQQSKNSATATIEIDAVSAVTAVAPQTIGAKKKRTRRARSTIKVGDLDPTSFAAKKAKTKKKKMKKKAKTKTKRKKKSSVSLVESAEALDGPKLKLEKEEKKKSEDGNISLMREERRDLYDLLYGDDSENSGEEDLLFEEADTMSNGAGGVIDLTVEPSTKNDSDNEPKGLSFFTATTDLDDENLDEFDPYNLDDY